jgi:hypothetical protein
MSWSHPCENCGGKVPFGLMTSRYCETCSRLPFASYGVPIIEEPRMSTFPMYLFDKERPVLMPGTRVKHYGTIGAVLLTEGERYYLCVGADGTVSMMPARDVSEESP